MLDIGYSSSDLLDIGHSSFDSIRVGSDNAFLECAIEGKADYLVIKKYSPFSLKKKRKGNPVSLL